MKNSKTNTYKSLFEKHKNYYLIRYFLNDREISKKKINFFDLNNDRKDNFNEQEILEYLNQKKNERGSSQKFEFERVECLINKMDNESDSECAKRHKFPTDNKNEKKKTVQSKSKLATQKEKFTFELKKNDQEISLKNASESDINEKQNLKNKNITVDNSIENKKQKIDFETQNKTTTRQTCLSLNDEIARSWLNLTYKKDYTTKEFNQFKIDNEIEDMERYLRNRAAETNERVISIDYKKLNSITVDYKAWSKEEHAKFVQYFGFFNKKFHIIAKLMEKSTKDVILHYYRTKKKQKYNTKKHGRISDNNLKIIIDLEWTESEKNKFLKLYEFYGKNWPQYLESFFGKTTNDFKNFYRYISKNLSNHHLDEIQEKQNILVKNENKTEIIKNNELTSEIKEPKKRGPKKKKVEKSPKAIKRKPRKNSVNSSLNSQNIEEKENIVNKKEQFSVLDEWTIDERQLFAIFYPYIGKNWVDLSQYITTKKPNDCRTYFKHYFKNLSIHEQKLEAAMRNVERITFSVPTTPKRLKDNDFILNAGILFKK